MAGLLSRLGFSLSKVLKNDPEKPDEEAEDSSPEILAMKEKRKDLYSRDALSVAEEYATYITPSLLKSLCDQHDFMHPHWGSRKVGRLVNLCRNILDIVILGNESVLTQSDMKPVLKLLFWCSILYPMTVIWVLKVEDVEKHFSSTFDAFLKEANLSTDERSLILHAVFNDTRTSDENIVMNIWHDALKLEEMQFGYAYMPELMRTSLGKNSVFSAKAKRDCLSNLSPHWLLHFQELLGETRFSSSEVAMNQDKHHDDDAIT